MRRVLTLVVVALAVLGAVGLDSLLRIRPADGDAYEPPRASRDDLAAAAGARVFFAHQSVGGNILDGVPAVFESHNLATPTVVDLADDPSGLRLVHQRVGKNGDPLGKIAEFDAILRAGLGKDVDVAILKLCYSDVRAETDVQQVFTHYTATIDALQRDYPDVTFIAATVPLSTQRDIKGNLKELLGRGDRYGAEHNVARERFNALLRTRYATGNRLFDVAAIESTAPDGHRVAARHHGDLYYSLAVPYAKDPGHLNASGAAVAAEGLFATIAAAIRP